MLFAGSAPVRIPMGYGDAPRNGVDGWAAEIPLIQRLTGGTLTQYALQQAKENVWEATNDRSEINLEPDIYQVTVLITDGAPAKTQDSIEIIVVAVEDAVDNLDRFQCFEDRGYSVLDYDSFVRSEQVIKDIFNVANVCDEEGITVIPFDGSYTRIPGSDEHGKPIYRNSEEWKAIWTGDRWRFYDPAGLVEGGNMNAVLYDPEYYPMPNRTWTQTTGNGTVLTLISFCQALL